MTEFLQTLELLCFAALATVGLAMADHLFGYGRWLRTRPRHHPDDQVEP